MPAGAVSWFTPRDSGPKFPYRPPPPARGYRHQRPLGQVITVTQHEHPFHYYRSPSEIREVQFSHRVRGLDEYEVAEYLDLLADQVHATDLELDRLRDELGRLRRENESLRTEMERSAARPRARTSPDATPQTASLLLNAQRVADDLVDRGFAAAAVHGDLGQGAREQALRAFRNGKVDVLVATDVAARGLDVEKIEHVINFDPPEDHRGYVHRVGRTGRAGRGGNGITLVTREQQGDVGRMAAALDLHDEFGESGMSVPPPRVVFSGAPGGRRSSLRPRRRSR